MTVGAEAPKGVGELLVGWWLRQYVLVVVGVMVVVVLQLPVAGPPGVSPML